MLDDPKQFLKTLPNKPGVYQMFDTSGEILYVGKAKNLKKRLQSYFRAAKDAKTSVFMEKVKTIEIIITSNENAALLLESNLIKSLKPRYNILFKDDKSFPYLVLSQHDFPRLFLHRGAQKIKGKYFGPFPDAAAAHFVLNLIQKIFHLRTCRDSFLCNRTRPCMLYQIKRCSAPCASYIDKAQYAVVVDLVEQFLRNKDDEVVARLTKLMDAESAKFAFENAAIYRDQIASIRKVQADQVIVRGRGSCDVVALVSSHDGICVNVLFVRHGLVLGNKSHFFRANDFDFVPSEILETFLVQHYLQRENNDDVPEQILLNFKLPNCISLSAVLCEKFSNKVVVTAKAKGVHKKLIEMAETNAKNTLQMRVFDVVSYGKKLLSFAELMGLATLPQRVECFDVSHMSGEAQMASCVVFSETGPCKSEYRKFNIKTARSSDDYGSLREALFRRYSKHENLPDVLMIDGGKGQLNIAVKILAELQISSVLIMAIAKGVARRPGEEEIYIAGRSEVLVLPPQSAGLHFIQQIRDEAHRFAIGSSRKKLLKTRGKSTLENISGIGKVKSRALLKYFGGFSEIKNASVDDLMKVRGISRNLAERLVQS